MPTVAVIIPVFNDRTSCRTLLRALAGLPGASNWSVCLVDDGSTADPPQTSDVTDAGLTGIVIRLPRNMGHQAAIACGIGYVAASWPTARAVIMDADGEDRPEAVPILLNELDANDLSAVVAHRRRRTESFSFRFFYRIYKAMFRLLTGHTIQFGNFMALSGPAVRRMASMHETWIHVAAALIASRIPRRHVPTDRGRRYSGQSSMNFFSLAVHGMRALMVFADAVLMRLVVGCVAAAPVAAILVLVALGLKLTGNATPGWFTSASGLLVVLVLQTAGIFAVFLVLAGISRGGIVRDSSAAFRDCIAEVETTS